MKKKYARITACLLILIMVFTNSSLGVFADSGKTADLSIQMESKSEVPEGFTAVCTKADLDGIRNNLIGNYILMNDIVFTEEDFSEGGSFYNEGLGWMPIGNGESFAGTFDGNGYKISGIRQYQQGTACESVGLFSQLSGTIHDLCLEDYKIQIQEVSGDLSVGSIAGIIDQGSLENCKSTGNLTITVKGGTERFLAAGGLAGKMTKGKLNQCESKGQLTVLLQNEKTIEAKVGGIVGTGDGTLTGVANYCKTEINSDMALDEQYIDCGGIAGYFDGSMNTASNDAEIRIQGKEENDNNEDLFLKVNFGGLVGAGNGDITDSFNTGHLYHDYATQKEDYHNEARGEESGCIGGIAGTHGYGDIHRCYNAGDLNINLKKAYKMVYLGGLIGSVTNTKTVTDVFNIGTLSTVPAEMVAHAAAGIICNVDRLTTYNAKVDLTNAYNLSSLKKVNTGTTTDKKDQICCAIPIYTTNVFYTGGVGSSTSATKLTLLQMQNKSSYTGFDFDTVWMFDEAGDSAYRYPQLRNLPVQTGKTTTHIWDTGTVTEEPTCENAGETLFTCTLGCGETKTEPIPRLGHDIVEDKAVAPTCTKTGLTAGEHCTRCSYKVAQKVVAMKNHTSSTKTNKATTTADGSIVTTCLICDKVLSKESIAKISTVKLSYTKKVYTGSLHNAPVLTVTDSNGKALKSGTDYTVTGLTGKTSVGKYDVKITFRGNYSGRKTLSFAIVPKRVSSASATLNSASSTGGYDDVKFSWSKATGATGYLVYYKKSTSSKYTYLKSVTGTSVTKKDLTDGAKYIFKVVPYYKESSGTTKYYSSEQYKTASVYTLKKVTDVKAVRSGTKVKVSWKNISGETGYQISKSTSKSKTGTITTYKTTSGKYKTISATKGKTYYYKVRAYRVVDGKKVYGPWSSVVKYKR